MHLICPKEIHNHSKGKELFPFSFALEAFLKFVAQEMESVIPLCMGKAYKWWPCATILSPSSLHYAAMLSEYSLHAKVEGATRQKKFVTGPSIFYFCKPPWVSYWKKKRWGRNLFK